PTSSTTRGSRRARRPRRASAGEGPSPPPQAPASSATAAGACGAQSGNEYVPATPQTSSLPCTTAGLKNTTGATPKGGPRLPAADQRAARYEATPRSATVGPRSPAKLLSSPLGSVVTRSTATPRP